jgi:hypothetical protein
MSRGFACALLGVGVTLLAWYGPWAWPAWPAFSAIDLIFAHRDFAHLPFGVRSAVVAGLITLNVSVWGGVAWVGVGVAMLGRVRPRSRPSEP